MYFDNQNQQKFLKIFQLIELKHSDQLNKSYKKVQIFFLQNYSPSCSLSLLFSLLNKCYNSHIFSQPNQKNMIESDKMEQQNICLANLQARCIQEIRFGLNEINLPFLERNELGKYFKQYPELKEMGMEGCKKKLSEGIEYILAETKKNTKSLIHPSQSRSQYMQLKKWLITHLQFIQKPQTRQQLTTLEYIEQQKKLVISTCLQLENLFIAQCKEKSEILKLITAISLQIINTLLIELENISGDMLVGYLNEKNSSEKDLIERINNLEASIQILEKEKNNKWKSLQIVVRDNRVLKKQNNKLIKMLSSQQQKVHILNQQHLKTKEQNEQLKLFFSSEDKDQTKKLSRYVQAKVKINQIDRLIKLYPKQAQKIACAELKKIQTTQLNTLQEKIAHIIQAIEKSGELLPQRDDQDDFLDTNKAKMCFNISVQTQKFTQQFGINTYNKVLHTKQTQVTSSLKHNHLVLVNQIVSEQIKPFKNQQVRNVQKKKTKTFISNIKSSLQKQNKQQSARQDSIKDIKSTKKVKWNEDVLILRTVNLKYLPDPNDYAFFKKPTSITRQKDFLSENDPTKRIQKQQDSADKFYKLSQTNMPEAIYGNISRASKQKITNLSSENSKNPSKISNLLNQQKILPKKSIPSNVIPKLNAKKKDKRQSQESLLSQSIPNQFFENGISFQKDLHEDLSKNESLLKQIQKQKISKRSSQFLTVGINSHVFKAEKYNRQTSVLLNRFKNSNMIITQMGQKRVSEQTFASLAPNSKKHLRTKTQGVDHMEETEKQQITTTFKHLRDSIERKKDLLSINKACQVQSEFEQTLKPKNRFCLTSLGDMERLQQVNSYKNDGQDEVASIDLVKSIERLIKNVSQRSVEIIKKEYLFKQFLLSFYQLHYGNSKQNIPKSYLQFLKELKKPRYVNNPMVQCLYLLMNQNFPQVYRREIFKLFTILIDKNGGFLTDYAGKHEFYKKIMTELLEIFIDPGKVQSIIKPMCLQQLKATLSDYFIAIEGEIRKRSINSQLYTFMIENIIQFGQTVVSFDIIKEITFFIAQGNGQVKNQLIQLRMYSEPFIELHRLCLIVSRLNFTEFLQIESLVDKKYAELNKNNGISMSPDSMVKLLAKQKFENFPYLKQILHRRIECFYKYNWPISENLLKLCQVNLFSQKLQNESPISNCLKAINQQSEKLQRLRHYKKVLENTTK